MLPDSVFPPHGVRKKKGEKRKMKEKKKGEGGKKMILYSLSTVREGGGEGIIAYSFKGKRAKKKREGGRTPEIFCGRFGKSIVEKGRGKKKKGRGESGKKGKRKRRSNCCPCYPSPGSKRMTRKAQKEGKLKRGRRGERGGTSRLGGVTLVLRKKKK